MIGGIHPCSFIDYPGCLSAVIFLRGCNLRCPYCHNPELLTKVSDGPTPSTNNEELVCFLDSRRGRLDGIVLSGGEPTLYNGLEALITTIRSFGFSVKLDTNGTRPDVLETLIQSALLDYIAMDLKDIPQCYPDWLRMHEPPGTLLRSIRLIQESGIDYEIRTTVLWPYHDSDRLIQMGRQVSEVKRWLLQPYCAKETLATNKHFNPPTDIQLEQLAESVRKELGINCMVRSGIGAKKPDNQACCSGI